MTQLVNDTEEKVETIFDYFYDSGLHKRNNEGKRIRWNSKTFCVFHTKEEQSAKVVANNRGTHAEIFMMEDHLVNYKNQGGEVTIYTNYSPCYDCAERIINFVCDPEWKMHLKIYFVQLYKVRRESCDMDGCCRDNEDNEKGLRQLSQYVTLHNFTNTQWKELAMLLGVVNTLRIENGNNISEYVSLYNFAPWNYITTIPPVDYNRGREDGQIALDLRHIIGLQAVRNAFSISGHHGVVWNQTPFFLMVRETIDKFGKDNKSFVFETEKDALRFLRNIFNKHVMLHMTHSPSYKFINDLVQLAKSNRTRFEVPFAKFHPKCHTPCSPSDILSVDDKTFIKHNNINFVDGVIVKEYNGFCINELERSLKMRVTNSSNLFNKDKCLENMINYYRLCENMKSCNPYK